MKKPHYIIGSVLFGLIGLVCFSPIAKAALTTTECIANEENICYTTYMADETEKINQCLLGVATKCPSTQEPKKNVAQCILECGNDTECSTKCQCTSTETYSGVTKKCEPNIVTQKIVAPGDETAMGITMGPTCLTNGQCGFDIYKLLGINRNSSATLFVQDVLLSATFFIGTVITIALLYSGIMFIMAGATGKDPSNAKNGIKYSIIGLLIVVTSYSLIRLIQYIAKGL